MLILTYLFYLSHYPVTPLFAIYNITRIRDSQHEPITPWDLIPEPPGTPLTINIMMVIYSVGGI